MTQNWRKQLSPNPDPESTNAWRILHSDELWIDAFDGKWLVQTADEAIPDFLTPAIAEGLATSIYWRPRSKSADTTPRHLAGDLVEKPFLARENGANYEIDFAAGYSCGIFLDQRENRGRIARFLVPIDDHGAPKRVLNTFAYTGAFSVIAALAGATTTTLDLSGPYLEWAKRNFAANNLDPTDHFFCKGDTFEWLATFARQGRTFHGVVLDPPTFSRSRGKKRKAPFRVEKDYAELLAAAAAVIEPGGWILCCANTHKLASWEFETMIFEGLGGREATLSDYPLPPEFGSADYLKSVRVTLSAQ